MEIRRLNNYQPPKEKIDDHFFSMYVCVCTSYPFYSVSKASNWMVLWVTRLVDLGQIFFFNVNSLLAWFLSLIVSSFFLKIKYNDLTTKDRICQFSVLLAWVLSIFPNKRFYSFGINCGSYHENNEKLEIWVDWGEGIKGCHSKTITRLHLNFNSRVIPTGNISTIETAIATEHLNTYISCFFLKRVKIN